MNGISNNGKEDENLDLKSSEIKYSAQFLKHDEQFFSETSANLTTTEKSVKPSTYIQRSVYSDVEGETQNTQTIKEIFANSDVDEHTEIITRNNDESTPKVNNFPVPQEIKEQHNLNSYSLNVSKPKMSNEPISQETLKPIDENGMNNKTNNFIKKEIRYNSNNMTEEKKNNSDSIKSAVEVVYPQPYEDNKSSTIVENITVVYPDENSEYLRIHGYSKNKEKSNTNKENEFINTNTTGETKHERICTKTRVVIKKIQEENSEMTKENDKENATEITSTTERSQNQIRHYLYRRRQNIPLILKSKTNKINDRLNEDTKVSQDLTPDGTENLYSTLKTDDVTKLINKMEISFKRENIMSKSTDKPNTPLQPSVEYEHTTINQNEDVSQPIGNVYLKLHKDENTETQTSISNGTKAITPNTLTKNNALIQLNNFGRIPLRRLIPKRMNSEDNHGISFNQTNISINSNIRLPNNTIVIMHENIYTTKNPSRSSLGGTQTSTSVKPFIPSPEYNPVKINQNFNRSQRPVSILSNRHEDSNTMNQEYLNHSKNGNNSTNYLMETLVKKDMIKMLNNLRQLSRHQQLNRRKNNQEKHQDFINQNNKNINNNNNNAEDEDNNGNYDEFYIQHYESKKITPKLQTTQNVEKRQKVTANLMNTNMKTSNSSVSVRPPLRRKTQHTRSRIQQTANQELKPKRNLIFNEMERNNSNNFMVDNKNNNGYKGLEKLLKENILMDFERIKMEKLNKNQQQKPHRFMNNRMRNQKGNFKLTAQKSNFEQIVTDTVLNQTMQNKPANNVGTKRSRHFRSYMTNYNKNNINNYNTKQHNSRRGEDNLSGSENNSQQKRINFRNRQTNQRTDKESKNNTQDLATENSELVNYNIMKTFSERTSPEINENKSLSYVEKTISSKINNKTEHHRKSSFNRNNEEINLFLKEHKNEYNDSSTNKSKETNLKYFGLGNHNIVSERKTLPQTEVDFVPTIEPKYKNIIRPIPYAIRTQNNIKDGDRTPPQSTYPKSIGQNLNVESQNLRTHGFNGYQLDGQDLHDNEHIVNEQTAHTKKNDNHNNKDSDTNKDKSSLKQHDLNDSSTENHDIVSEISILSGRLKPPTMIQEDFFPTTESKYIDIIGPIPYGIRIYSKIKDGINTTVSSQPPSQSTYPERIETNLNESQILTTHVQHIHEQTAHNKYDNSNYENAYKNKVKSNYNSTFKQYNDLTDSGSENHDIVSESTIFSGRLKPPDTIEEDFIPTIDHKNIKIIGPIPVPYSLRPRSKTKGGDRKTSSSLQSTYPGSGEQKLNDGSHTLTNTHGVIGYRIDGRDLNHGEHTYEQPANNKYENSHKNKDKSDYNSAWRDLHHGEHIYEQTARNKYDNRNYENSHTNKDKSEYNSALRQYNEALKIYNDYLEKFIEGRH